MPTKKTSGKSSAWDKAKYWTIGTGGTGAWLMEKGLEALGVGGGLGLFKDGGRVRGVGKATHGYGKAMKKQGKK